MLHEKKFLDFAKHLTDCCCPWQKSFVRIYTSYIELTFITSSMVRPSDLGWLNTHAVGGTWSISAVENETNIVVRFFDDEDIV